MAQFEKHFAALNYEQQSTCPTQRDLKQIQGTPAHTQNTSLPVRTRALIVCEVGSITWTFVAATEFSLDARLGSPFRQQTVDFVESLQPKPRVLVLHIPLWREQCTCPTLAIKPLCLCVCLLTCPAENCTSLRQTTKQIPYYVRQTYPFHHLTVGNLLNLCCLDSLRCYLEMHRIWS